MFDLVNLANNAFCSFSYMVVVGRWGMEWELSCVRAESLIFRCRGFSGGSGFLEFGSSDSSTS